MASLMRHRGFRAAVLIRRAAISTYRERSPPSLSENIRPFCSWSPLIFPRPASKPGYESTDQRWLRKQLFWMPNSSSLSNTKYSAAKTLVIQSPVSGLEKVETDEGLSVLLNMDGLEDMQVNVVVDDNHLIIRGRKNFETIYLIGLKLPATCKKNTCIKGLMIHDGKLRVTVPTAKYNVLGRLAYFLTKSFEVLLARVTGAQDIYTGLFFNRPYVVDTFLVACAHPDALDRSFTNYKKHTPESLYIKLSAGLWQTESTSEGLCVSLNMPGFEIEDVTSSFENGKFLLIEGKKDAEHYLAGILIPEGYETKIDVIKTEMHQGLFTATLPSKTVEAAIKNKTEMRERSFSSPMFSGKRSYTATPDHGPKESGKGSHSSLVNRVRLGCRPLYLFTKKLLERILGFVESFFKFFGDQIVKTYFQDDKDLPFVGRVLRFVFKMFFGKTALWGLSKDQKLPKVSSSCIEESSSNNCIQDVLVFSVHNGENLKVFYTRGFICFFTKTCEELLYEPFKYEIRSNPEDIAASMDFGILYVTVPKNEEAKDSSITCFEIEWDVKEEPEIISEEKFKAIEKK